MFCFVWIKHYRLGIDHFHNGRHFKYYFMCRAATVNRNIGYPRFRTHGSVSVRLFQISVRFRFVFFLTINVVKTDILTGKFYKISIFYYHSKNEKIWHPPVSLSRPSGNISIFWSPFCYCFMFVVEKIYTFTL